MRLDRGTAPRQDIGRDVDLERDLPLRQDAHELAVVLGLEPVADPLDAHGQRLTNFQRALHRPRGLAGVAREPQACPPGLGVDVAEPADGAPDLVAADADAHDGREPRPQLGGQAEHAADLVGAELPRGVGDPEHRRPAELPLDLAPRALEALHDLLDRQVRRLPVQDVAPRHVDLGVGDALGVQVANHVARDQGVVVGRLHAVEHELERPQEVQEVLEHVQRARLVERQRLRVVPRRQHHERLGRHRPLEVQVQLGLGEAPEPLSFCFCHFLEDVLLLFVLGGSPGMQIVVGDDCVISKIPDLPEESSNTQIMDVGSRHR